MKATERETLALGWLSAELASRADAWDGNAPEWFPEPPEWLELWEQALTATQPVSARLLDAFQRFNRAWNATPYHRG